MSDIEIVRQSRPEPILEIAREIGLTEDDIELYGKYKAKIKLGLNKKFRDLNNGKYIAVTAITPTAAGEGKTVVNIGLAQALARLGKKVISTLRQPSMGPIFGIKGRGTGGGYCQVVPMEDINLHFTGDIHAVGAANNLLAAMIDNHIFHPRFKRNNELDIDPTSITWKRVVDLGDAALANIMIGMKSTQKIDGYPRESGFDITVASEVMSILSLATDLTNLRKRLGRIMVAKNRSGKPVTAEDLKAAGAMCVLLKDALKPNLVQTLENVPCIIHGGPFANISIGNNSVIADKIALKLADYVVTESGFGSEMGAEKLMNIKCRQSGLRPDCVVIVATIRALKIHGGALEASERRKGSVLDEDVESTRKGCANLAKHVNNMKKFGVPVVICINRFVSDTDAEIRAVIDETKKAGAAATVSATVWADGGNGGIELAKVVLDACEKPHTFKFLYPDDMPIKDKIEVIAKEMYGAASVEYSETAEKKIKLYTEWKHDTLPICISKTHLSLSHDPNMKGVPVGYTLPIVDIIPATGAGYLNVLAGEIMTMPGLPSRPAAINADLDEYGRIVGLF
ncbi:MAG: formate--tetrahydrofolate ligase [Nitrososphaerales archaeon]